MINFPVFSIRSCAIAKPQGLDGSIQAHPSTKYIFSAWNSTKISFNLLVKMQSSMMCKWKSMKASEKQQPHLLPFFVIIRFFGLFEGCIHQYRQQTTNIGEEAQKKTLRWWGVTRFAFMIYSSWSIFLLWRASMPASRTRPPASHWLVRWI